MSNQKLKKGILIVFATNIINLAFKLVLNFVMPKFLSVDVYADYKYFQLLFSYIGILHFGYIDGIYLKLGGKDISNINKNEIADEYSALFMMQAIITAVCVAVSSIISDKIAIMTSFIIIPTQITTFYRYIYQATGEFKRYGKILNLSTILTSISILILILLGVDNSPIYIIAYSLCTYFVFFYLVLNNRVRIHANIRLRTFLNLLKIYISSGIFIMLGNFATTFLTGMDRWFIKILMDNVAFAQYSFSVSIVSFLSIAISPFSITLYNYFCANNTRKNVIEMTNKIIVLAIAIVCCYFPAKFLLEHYISEYIGASDSLAFLFAAQMIHILITCIYQNLYKALKLQRKYSIKMIVMIAVGFMSNAIMYYIWHTKEAFAIATLLTTAIWFVLCYSDFKEYRLAKKTVVFMILEIIAFLLSGCLLNAVYGFAVYLGISILLIISLMRSEFHSAIKVFLSMRQGGGYHYK